MDTQPLVSIVTPSFNAADTIQETIESVLGQTYPNIEYIIMDGNSNDGTQDIVQAYEGRLQLISEPDDGQSDAINKGWKRCTGDIVAWLCADDMYYPDTVESMVAAFLDKPDTMWTYGLADYVDKAGKPTIVRDPTYEWNYQNLFEYGNFITQPTVFMRREILNELGYVRTDLHFTMDYEIWLRVGAVYPAVFIQKPLAIVRTYPETKTSSGGIKRMGEYEYLMSHYGWEDIPEGMRHDWTRIYLKQIFTDLSQGQVKQSTQSLSGAFRYPNHIPRAVMKGILNSLPLSLQRQLRLLLLRNSSE